MVNSENYSYFLGKGNTTIQHLKDEQLVDA
jgi:hypothetical protein